MTLSPDFMRRAWPLVVGALIATMAYFQASGVGSLVSASIAPKRVEVQLPGGAPTVERPAMADAEPILDRNPFDSVTGPLNTVPPEDELEPSEPAIPKDPLSVPTCAGVDVEATTESTDPLWSLAVIQASGEPRGHVHRVGDSVGDKRIAYIGYNPKELSPAVWLTGSDGLCQSLLFDDDPEKPKPKKGLKLPQKKKPAPRRRGPPPLPEELAKKIQKVSATEFNVDRSVVDEVVENYSKLLRSTLVKPVMKDGRVQGVRVTRINPDSLLGKLGMKNGDVLKDINGFPMASPEKALAAYARLRTANEIKLAVLRGNKPVNIDIHIR